MENGPFMRKFFGSIPRDSPLKSVSKLEERILLFPVSLKVARLKESVRCCGRGSKCSVCYNTLDKSSRNEGGLVLTAALAAFRNGLEPHSICLGKLDISAGPPRPGVFDRPEVRKRKLELVDAYDKGVEAGGKLYKKQKSLEKAAVSAKVASDKVDKLLYGDFKTLGAEAFLKSTAQRGRPFRGSVLWWSRWRRRVGVL